MRTNICFIVSFFRQVLIVDLDNNKLLECMGDESTIIPKKLQKALAMALHMCKEDGEYLDPGS